MKRCIIAILALLYISTANGIVVYVHYCMGELIEWSLEVKKTERCSICGMKKSSNADNDCCKDEQKQVKLEEHNRAGNPLLQLSKPACLIIHATDSGYTEIASTLVIKEETAGDSTTEFGTNNLYLRYRVFRI